jgi:hypothetical protein
MIQILKESGPENEKAAIKLEYYNTSPKFMEESYEIELKVTPARELYGPSKCFEMNKKPRGLFLLINNLSSIITKESLRFKNIFEQLLFDVELLYDKTANEMKEKFESLAKDKRLLEDQALVVMIISHGYNDKVEGVDKKVLSVRSIVDIFSEDNCKLLSRKPKLFFFNCCRDSKYLKRFKFILKSSVYILINFLKIIYWLMISAIKIFYYCNVFFGVKSENEG